MKKYKIAIEETLSKIIEIDAETPSLAVCEVENQYNAEEIVLSADDYSGTDIALSVEDKQCQEYLENPLFCSFVDSRLKQILPELDMEGKMRLAFGSPDNAIFEFENRTGGTG